MRDLFFLFIFDFVWIKGNINSPRYLIFTSFTLKEKCLECATNPLLQSLSGSVFLLGFVSNGVCFHTQMLRGNKKKCWQWIKKVGTWWKIKILLISYKDSLSYSKKRGGIFFLKDVFFTSRKWRISVRLPRSEKTVPFYDAVFKSIPIFSSHLF